jgi:hypothetical protein
MGSWKIWYLTLIYFCLQIAVHGTTFYLPEQASGLIGQDVGCQVGLISAVPWLVGLFNGPRSLGRERVERGWEHTSTMSDDAASFDTLNCSECPCELTSRHRGTP